MKRLLNLNIRTAVLILLLLGCASSVDPYTESLTPAEYFQRAYEASDKANYKLALDYYQAFQQKFPDDTERNLKALYEIAFIYHKMGNDKEAVELFDELIARYDSPEATAYPTAPKALAEKVKTEILKKVN